MVRGLFSEYSEPFRSQICTQKGRKVDRMDALQIFLIAQEANEQENLFGLCPISCLWLDLSLWFSFSAIILCSP